MYQFLSDPHPIIDSSDSTVAPAENKPRPPRSQKRVSGAEGHDRGSRKWEDYKEKQHPSWFYLEMANWSKFNEHLIVIRYVYVHGCEI